MYERYDHYANPCHVIRVRRQEMGLREAEFASMFRLAESELEGIESGRAPIPLDKVVALAVVLDIDPGWFLHKVVSFIVPPADFLLRPVSVDELLRPDLSLKHARN